MPFSLFIAPTFHMGKGLGTLGIRPLSPFRLEHITVKRLGDNIIRLLSPTPAAVSDPQDSTSEFSLILTCFSKKKIRSSQQLLL